MDKLDISHAIVGIDLGSRRIKIAARRGADGVLKGGEDGFCEADFSFRAYDPMRFYSEHAFVSEEGLKLRTEDADIRIMACGYGRRTVKVAGGFSVPEIEAHSAGAAFQSGESDFLLIDLGGQDSKVIKVSGGRVADFITNDKCAASSGRYLENMAQALGISLAELSSYKDAPASLSSTCAVFGESELVGEIVAGTALPSLAAGVNLSVAKRVFPLAHRFLPAKHIYLSGGVALNRAVLGFLSDLMGSEIIPLPNPQFNGAIGCAVLCERKLSGEVL